MGNRSDNEYIIKGSVVNGDFVSGNISREFERFYISLNFYSDDFKTIVEPTAGTVTLTASENGVTYGSIENGVVEASGAYNRPSISGRLRNIKANLAGVAGAINFEIVISAYGN